MGRLLDVILSKDLLEGSAFPVRPPLDLRLRFSKGDTFAKGSAYLRQGSSRPTAFPPSNQFPFFELSDWDFGENRIETVRSFPNMSEVSRILDSIQQGNAKAADELLPLVYDELRKIAALKMAKEPPGQTLQPTALVHEAWIRLTGNDASQRWNNRGHFFCAAAEAMRRILIDKARRKNRLRHGKGLIRVDFEKVDVAINSDDETLLRVDEALERFEQQDQVKAELVRLRFFLGLSLAEAGQALGLSESTAKRHWVYARAWLYDALKPSA